jgi:hypothetical protein
MAYRPLRLTDWMAINAWLASKYGGPTVDRFPHSLMQADNMHSQNGGGLTAPNICNSGDLFPI